MFFYLQIIKRRLENRGIKLVFYSSSPLPKYNENE